MQQRERFATLDGFRGIAAIMVMLGHAQGAMPAHGAIDRSGLPTPDAAGGYLAVDLFFGLSGFVLAHAYGEALRNGLSPARFMLLRLFRLYPMYFIVALACGGGIGQLLMIPHIAPGEAMYLPNVPMWSLLLELAASLLYAVAIAHLSWRGICAVICASGALLAWHALAVRGSVEFGAGFYETPWELTRTLFSFTVGVALYRLRAQRGSTRGESGWGWLLLALLPLPFLVAPATRAWWDLFCVFVLFPAAIWLGAGCDLPRSRLVKALGDLSYPLYCIHFPLLILAAGAGFNLSLAALALIAAAWALDRWYDRPARDWLRGLTKRGKTKLAAA